MNIAFVSLILSVVVLGGCTQNQPQRRIEQKTTMTEPQQGPAETAGSGTSVFDKAKGLEVTLKDKNLQAKFETASSGPTQSIAANDVTPSTKAPGTFSVEAPGNIGQAAATGAGQTGPSTSPTTLQVQPSMAVGSVRGQEQRFRPAASQLEIAADNEKSESSQVAVTNKVKVTELKAYTQVLAPMLMKVRTMHPGTAERLESALQATEDLQSDSKNETDMAQSLLSGALLRLATDSASAKNPQFKATVTSLSQEVARQMIATRHSFNTRMVYEFLRRAQISVQDWKFEEISAQAASSELIRWGGYEYSVSSAEPSNQFKINKASNTSAADCKININWTGIETGTRVQVSEPEWREFDLSFSAKSTENLPLRPSLAGDNFLDLEFTQTNNDKSFTRLTLRYQKSKSGDKTSRQADQMVLETMSEAGARQILICKVALTADNTALDSVETKDQTKVPESTENKAADQVTTAPSFKEAGSPFIPTSKAATAVKAAAQKPKVQSATKPKAYSESGSPYVGTASVKSASKTQPQAQLTTALVRTSAKANAIATSQTAAKAQAPIARKARPQD